MVWGTRSVLRFGLVVTILTALLGTLVGAVSGYLGGIINRLVMRITDAFLTFPAIAAVFLFGQMMIPPSPDATPTAFQKAIFTMRLDPVMLALILCSWMPYARLINANIIRLKQTEYAMAAQTVGVPPLRIILRHLLPNALAPVVVLAARDVGGLVILEAAFTFIGVGGNSTWGRLLVAGRDWIIGPGGNPLTYWWIFLPPTLALVLFSIAWNILGDSLNTLLNPRSRQKVRRFAWAIKPIKPHISASDAKEENWETKRNP
jgi:peptide/nickel transport system permease protein